MQRMTCAMTVALLTFVVGCAAPEVERREAAEAPEPTITIHGSLAFRDGVTPPTDSVATVTVSDFAAAGDSEAAVAAKPIDLESARVLLPFELSVPVSSFEAGRQYVVRATVSGPQGDVLWTTDVAQLIDPARMETDVGVLLMTRSRTIGQRGSD